MIGGYLVDNVQYFIQLDAYPQSQVKVKLQSQTCQTVIDWCSGVTASVQCSVTIYSKRISLMITRRADQRL